MLLLDKLYEFDVTEKILYQMDISINNIGKMIDKFPKGLKTERKIRKFILFHCKSKNLKTFKKNTLKKNIMKDKKGGINKEIRNY